MYKSLLVMTAATLSFMAVSVVQAMPTDNYNPADYAGMITLSPTFGYPVMIKSVHLYGSNEDHWYPNKDSCTLNTYVPANTTISQPTSYSCGLTLSTAPDGSEGYSDSLVMTLAPADAPKQTCTFTASVSKDGFKLSSESGVPGACEHHFSVDLGNKDNTYQQGVYTIITK